MKISFRTGALASLALAAGLSAPASEPVGAARKLIDQLQMAKIPVEGAWFKVTYGSVDRIAAEALPSRYGAARAAGSAIYALVTREDFSAMHRLKTDEIWHFYAGDPIELLVLHPDGRDEVVVLGPDFSAGQQPQFAVPAGAWMGAWPTKANPEAYGFFGTTMAPGFDDADFEPGYRAELQQSYPKQSALIAQLTRADWVTRPVVAAKTDPLPPSAAPAAPVVFEPDSVAPVAFGPGVELRELVGRVARAKSDRASVAHFRLAPGQGTGTSYTKVSEEYFLVLTGRGTVMVGEDKSPVKPGTIVVLKPGTRHSLTAASDSPLEFYAITAPAFSPDDYVPVNDLR